MYSIRFEWKSFSLNLVAIETQLKQISTDYCGNSADIGLTLWFTEEPSDETKSSIQSYWEGLSEASDEATSYVAADTITARIAELKAGMLTKSWDEMSQTERKLMLNQSVSNSELGF
jgi:hypothetical protein